MLPRLCHQGCSLTARYTRTARRAVTRSSPYTRSVLAPPLQGTLSQSCPPQLSCGASVRQYQTLDYTALTACCAELREKWLPSKVEEVVQPDKYTICIRLRTLESHGWLHLSWHPSAARVCIGPAPLRGGASEAFSFAEIVQKQLYGRVLLSVDLPAPWERVAEIAFGERPGDAPTHRVYCEVMGKYSNVILCNAGGQVTTCGFQVGGKMSSLRQVQQGRPYALPPVPNGIPPDPTEPLQVWRETVTKAADLAASQSRSKAPVQPRVLGGCVRAYQGTSPALVEELCLGAGVAAGAHPEQLEEGQWVALHREWVGWMERLQRGEFVATMDEASGRFSVLGRYSRQYGSVHEMLGEYYGGLQASEQQAALHQRLSSTLAAALKKARGKVVAFERQLRSSDEADAVQKVADLITANLYKIKSGAKEVEVEDWDTTEMVVLPLDPMKTPAQNSEALYRKARKLRKAVDAVGPLLERVRQEVEYLEEIESTLSQLKGATEADDLRALREVQDELVEAGILRPPTEQALATKVAAKAKKVAKKQAKRSGGQGMGPAFRQFKSPSGMKVLVGRNNRQNDELSLRVAAAEDLWMHVKGMPGSHTVLRIPSGQAAADEDIQFAADLAAFYSKGRNETKVEVVLCQAGNVKKPKGAKPGQVSISGERSWVARPSASVAATVVQAADAGDFSM